MKELDIKQFINLLNFIALMSSSKYVLELSPDYIIEKYKRYINNNTDTISDVVNHNGIHHIIKRDVIEAYIEKWLDNLIDPATFWDELEG
jgi:hypothetical protein